jgi:hypothetical protein
VYNANISKISKIEETPITAQIFKKDKAVTVQKSKQANIPSNSQIPHHTKFSEQSPQHSIKW